MVQVDLFLVQRLDERQGLWAATGSTTGQSRSGIPTSTGPRLID